MATVLVRNTKEHDITINLVLSNEVVSTTFPAARASELIGGELVYTDVPVDEAVMSKAAKSSQVVKHYFESGMLVPSKGAAPAESPAA